ncbi:MAG: hypothetical protein GY719_20815 [bacterium]|nr:hypothetical protein [bacterium]
MQSLRHLLLAAVLLSFVAPALAWTPASQQAIAEHAARLAPPDLYRQLARNRLAYLQGVRDGFAERDPQAHAKNADGSGRLDASIAAAVDNAIRTITAHQPFNEVSYRLGIVSHFVADANNPLNAEQSDPEEARYFADYLSYLESVEPRVRIVFYGFEPGADGNLPRLLDTTLERSRKLYPMVGREYRRVRFQSGRRAFDDRSTAYAVAGLAYSHAVSDIAQVLRYIWLEAGGIDTRRRVPLRGRDVIQLPRQGASPRR